MTSSFRASSLLFLALLACNRGSESICDDGLDNDADGFVDCDDPDCSDQSECVEGDTDTDTDSDTDTDADTDTAVPVDEDGDGFFSVESGGDDCDDGDVDVHPGADEYCNGVDDDCDDEIDEGDALDASTWYADADGDDYGDAGTTVEACSEPSGYTDDATDCDDVESGVHPGAEEVCNNHLDDDCDGTPGDCTFQAENSLSDADARFDGEAYGNSAGYSLASAGDVDGDGLSDIVIGDWCEDTNGENAGAAYLVLGSTEPVSLSLTSAAAKYTGEDAGDGAGLAVAGAGVVNGDGLGDILVGAFFDEQAGNDAGSAYLVLGSSSPTDANLSSVDACFTGESEGANAGRSVAGAGDVNGDGFDDVLIGSASLSMSYSSDEGAAYLVLGSANPSGFPLSYADARFLGEPDDHAGYSASGAGDFDGDGLDDVVIGAAVRGSNMGAAYLVLGTATPGDLTLPSAALCYTGQSAGDNAGSSVAGAQDVNGDGFDDIIVGAPYCDIAGEASGAAYIVFGGSGPTSSSLSVADARLTGEAAGGNAGESVTGAGDVNADGFSDVLIGANHGEIGGELSGAAYLVLGGPGLANLSLSMADARFTGEAALDTAGEAVGGGGDVNGDGFDDMLIGAPGYDSGVSDAGAAYLILGIGE